MWVLDTTAQNAPLFNQHVQCLHGTSTDERVHPPFPPCRRTGLVYDPQMQEHVNEVDPSHPERPERVGKMWQALTEGGLVGRCRRVLSREAGHEELKLVHR